MTAIYNVYCDESGHLEHDQLPVMVLGALWCLLEDAPAVAADLRSIKIRHGLSSDFEIKWVKVSPAKQQFYLDVLDYFFSTQGLHFRALIVPDKSALRHEAFGQDHDTWYYKMYFDLLKVLFLPDAEYRIYLDIKDTLGTHKVAKLHDVLCNSIYDFQKEIIARLQTVRSHEVALLQLADLLIGIVAYANRGLQSNTAKLALVSRMREYSGYALTRTTLLREEKVNLFRWHPRESPR